MTPLLQVDVDVSELQERVERAVDAARSVAKNSGGTVNFMETSRRIPGNVMQQRKELLKQGPRPSHTSRTDIRSHSEAPSRVSREAPAVNISDTTADGQPNYLSLDDQFWRIGWQHMTDTTHGAEWTRFISANLLQGRYVRDAQNLVETNKDTLRVNVGFFNFGKKKKEEPKDEPEKKTNWWTL